MRKYWNTASNGAFATSGNWAPAGAPGANDLAFITATGSPYTVTVSANAEVLGVSLGANATLDITNNAIFHADEGTATGKNIGVIQVETGSKFIFATSPGEPVLTRTLCGEYLHARKFDIRRGTGIGTAVLGG